MPESLQEQYKNSIAPQLREKFGYPNVMQIPHLAKVVVNMGVGDAIADPRLMDSAVNELMQITGQRPKVCTAHKSISNFKLRAGMKIGCMVTLRGRRMYEFTERLVNIALPRVRDFRGISPRGFDKFGNFTLGLREQTIFPEVDMDSVQRVRGMNVTFVIKNATSAEEGRELLRLMGMPFTAN